MANNSRGQGEVGVQLTEPEKLRPKLRRLGQKAIDSIRISVGKETKSGVAEASALERSVTLAAGKKNKPGVLEGLGWTKEERTPEQTRRRMAALGSEKHLPEFRKQLPEFGNGGSHSSNLKTAVGKRLNRRRDGVALSKDDVASVSKKLKRNGIADSDQLKADLEAALGSQRRNLKHAPSAESWQSGNSTASTLKNPKPIGIARVVAKDAVNIVDIPARNDRSRSRLTSR